MKAVSYAQYGSPDVLSVGDVEVPAPARGEVLIRTLACSLNASDREFLTGTPVYTRAWGLRRPRYTILGSDIAGRVEAVGPDVTEFAVGDAVFGDVMERWGGLAEYTCAPVTMLTRKPDALSFEQAAAIPQAACVALQALSSRGRVTPGQRVLIAGAGGGSGSFAVQMARHFGAEVTGVDRGEKADAMRSWGAAHVLDYRREDFTRRGETYDRIVDLVAAHPLADCTRALAADGVYLLVGGSMRRLLGAAVWGPLASLFRRRRMGVLAVEPNADMPEILDMIETGAIAPIIDRCFPLSDTADAFRYLDGGHAKGKIVITIADA